MHRHGEIGRRQGLLLDQLLQQGEGAGHVKVGQTVVRINPRFYRPAEVELLIGDAGKARDKLGWQASTTLEELCQMMVKADLRRVQRGVSF